MRGFYIGKDVTSPLTMCPVPEMTNDEDYGVELRGILLAPANIEGIVCAGA